MIDNVFSPAFGNRPKTMVGREDVKREIENICDSRPGSRERATLILGQRGSGKTVLLLEIADIAREHNYVVASPTVVSNGMCGRIIEKLLESGRIYLKEGKAKITGFNIEVLGFGGGVEFEREVENRSFAYRITHLVRALNQVGKAALILIDEAQANHEELRQLIIAYQEMVGEGLDVMLVLAGLPVAISTLLNDKILTFLNRANKIYLSPLRTGEIDSYYAKVFQNIGVKLPEGRRKEAAECAQGSPYLMQVIGHYIVLFADENGTLTEAEFRDATEVSKKEFLNDVCKTTMDALSEKDCEFLEHVAKEKGENVSMAAIAEQMNVSRQYAQLYRQRLIQAGVIEPAGRGLIRFAVPYLREYLLEMADDKTEII